MVGSLYDSRKYQTPATMPYLYKSQVRSRMKHRYYIWAAAYCPTSTESKSADAALWVINYSLLCNLFPINEASPAFHHYGRCLDELPPIVPPARTFAARIFHAVLTVAKEIHFLCFLLTKSKFHSGSFFPRNVTLWNKFRRQCFPWQLQSWSL